MTTTHGRGGVGGPAGLVVASSTTTGPPVPVQPEHTICDQATGAAQRPCEPAWAAPLCDLCAPGDAMVGDDRVAESSVVV